ncbi:MAG: hypothetical protein HOA58_00510 [Rhodospirillaceae bacterium]|nr:hypothetical protein [Rhodospirillaceae bacterium]
MAQRIDISQINISGIVMLMLLAGLIAAAVIHPPSENRVPRISDDDRRVTAIHESGHALLAANLPAGGELLEMTIISHWGTLGSVTRAPAREGISDTELRARRMAELIIAQGGLIAEEMLVGSDAPADAKTSDIKAAEKIAFDLLGGAAAGLSLAEADAEVKKLLASAEQRARNILTSREAQLHALTKSLVEHGTLSGAEIAIILGSSAAAGQQENTE